MKKKSAPSLSEDLPSPDTNVREVLAELACTNTALRRASRRLGQLYDEALAPIDLKATQLGLLAEIDRHITSNGPEGPTLQILAGRLAIGISGLTHALRPLVRDGFVKILQDSKDGRTKHGILTPLGKIRLRKALELWAATNRRVEVVIGRATVETLRGLADEVASEEFLVAYNAGSQLSRP